LEAQEPCGEHRAVLSSGDRPREGARGSDQRSPKEEVTTYDMYVLPHPDRAAPLRIMQAVLEEAVQAGLQIREAARAGEEARDCGGASEALAILAGASAGFVYGVFRQGGATVTFEGSARRVGLVCIALERPAYEIGGVPIELGKAVGRRLALRLLPLAVICGRARSCYHDVYFSRRLGRELLYPEDHPRFRKDLATRRRLPLLLCYNLIHSACLPADEMETWLLRGCPMVGPYVELDCWTPETRETVVRAYSS
jgi:hypothetical protein